MRIEALLLAAALAAGPAWAEKADREKEIVMNADHGVADDAKRTTTFDGDVVITQGTMRITADKVTVHEDPNHHKFYVAYGNPVTFRQKRDNADEYIEGYAQRAEFDDQTDMLKLYDKARVKSNQNELTGNFISYDMGRELAQVSGAPPGQKPPEGSRVKVVIIPPKKGEDGKAAPAPAQPGIRLKPDTSGTP
jgi:lipopolysaccharide export system protein LptA